MIKGQGLQKSFGGEPGPATKQFVKLRWLQTDMMGYFVKRGLFERMVFDEKNCIADKQIISA